MINEHSLGSLPKTGFLAPLAVFTYFLQERILRGFDMKFTSKIFNIKALQNHLALTRSQAWRLDEVAESINFKKVALTVHVISENEMKIFSEPKSGSVADNSILAIHAFDLSTNAYDDPKIQIIAPLSILRKGCSDTSHLVYRIDTFSPGRLDGYIKTLKLPEPNLNLIENTSAYPIPFDVATRGKVPAYIGKTSVGFANRLKQHLSSASAGSSTRFHKVLRGSDKYQAQYPVCQILASFETESKAYDFEEEQIKKLVSEDTAYCCNTIGSRQAFDNLIALEPRLKNQITAEEAEELLMLRSKNAAANWHDPDYVERVICNNERNFDADEIRLIRSLYAMKMPLTMIAKKFNAPFKRVKSVIERVTYSRIL